MRACPPGKDGQFDVIDLSLPPLPDKHLPCMTQIMKTGRTSRLVLLALMAVVAGVPSDSRAVTDLLVEIFPGTVLAHMDSDAFTVSSPTVRESVSMVSSVPNLSIGMAVAQPEGYFDFKVGAGLLLNSRLRSILFSVGAGLSLEYRPSVLIGPHVQWHKLQSPEWWGDAEVSFDESDGWQAGIHLATGDRISYLLSLDYTRMKLNVSGVGGDWTVNRTELDMSGISVQFGIRTQF